MKKPFPYYRFIQSDDDGCSIYQCLACKARWNARYCPTNFCAGCGIKFLGDHKCESRDEKSWRRVAKESDKKIWVIEAKRECKKYPERNFYWTPMDGYPRHSTCAVFDLLKRYRLQEKNSREKTALEWGPDFGFDEEISFRANLVDKNVYIFNQAGVDYPSPIEDQLRWHELEMEEIRKQKEGAQC